MEAIAEKCAEIANGESTVEQILAKEEYQDYSPFCDEGCARVLLNDYGFRDKIDVIVTFEIVKILDYIRKIREGHQKI